jgi:hypothetical protein
MGRLVWAAGWLAAAAVVVSGPARAQLTQVQSVANGGVVLSAQAGFPQFGGGFNIPPTYAFNGFNAAGPIFGFSPGVLQAVTVDYDTVFAINGQTSASNGFDGPPRFIGTAAASASFTALDVSQTASLSTAMGCTGAAGATTCSAAASVSQAFHVHQTLTDPQALSDYYSAGASGITARPMITTSLTPTDLNTLSVTASETASLTPSALSVTYSYLKHAQPSLFGSLPFQLPFLTLDLGTVYQGDAASADGAIFNLGDVNTIGLDLVGIAPLGPAGPFSLNLTGFSNLAAGSSDPFKAFLDTSTLGQFQTTYLLNLSDADQGVGQDSYTMRLTLVGDVVARPLGPPVDPPGVGGVPEPGSWALMLVGFGSVGAALRARPRRGLAHS